MKKLYTVALVGLIGVLLESSIAKADTLFTKDLYFGIQGDSEVTKLQEFLTDQNVYSGPITGNFFSLTLAGVKSFQTREGVTPSAGYFGPLTRAKANAFLSPQLSASEQQAVLETGSVPTPPPPPATTGDVVNSLQTQINLLLQQIQLLQQQLSTQQQTQQILQQIQQNTTPPIAVIVQPPSPQLTPSPTPSPTPVPTLSEVDISTLLSRYSFTTIGDTKARFSIDGVVPLNQQKVTASLDGIKYNQISSDQIFQNLQRNTDYTLYLRAETKDKFGKTTIPFRTKLGFTVSVSADSNSGQTYSPQRLFKLIPESHEVPSPVQLKSVKLFVSGQREKDPYTYNLLGKTKTGIVLFDTTITAEILPGCTPTTCGAPFGAFLYQILNKEIEVPINQTVNESKDQYGYSYEMYDLITTVSGTTENNTPYVKAYSFTLNGQEYTYQRADFNF